MDGWDEFRRMEGDKKKMVGLKWIHDEQFWMSCWICIWIWMVQNSRPIYGIEKKCDSWVFQNSTRRKEASMLIPFEHPLWNSCIFFPHTTCRGCYTIMIFPGWGQGELQRSGLCCPHWGLHGGWRWLREQPGIRLGRLRQQRTLPHRGQRCSGHTLAGGEFLHGGVVLGRGCHIACYLQLKKWDDCPQWPLYIYTHTYVYTYKCSL